MQSANVAEWPTVYQVDKKERFLLILFYIYNVYAHVNPRNEKPGNTRDATVLKLFQIFFEKSIDKYLSPGVYWLQRKGDSPKGQAVKPQSRGQRRAP